MPARQVEDLPKLQARDVTAAGMFDGVQAGWLTLSDGRLVYVTRARPSRIVIRGSDLLAPQD